jgi:hypothetical protein
VSEAFEARIQELAATPEGREMLRAQALSGLAASLQLRRHIKDSRNRARSWIAMLRIVKIFEKR